MAETAVAGRLAPIYGDPHVRPVAKSAEETSEMIASPCTDICLLDPRSGFCFGCGRTGDEIGGWSGYDDAERATIISSLGERLASLTLPGRLEGREERRARLTAGRNG